MDIEKFFEVLGVLFAENNNVVIKAVKIEKIQKEVS